MKTIKFYKPDEPYGEFSNFSPHPILLDDKIWPTIEHYFQAKKFENALYEEFIRNLPSPMDARIAGRDKSRSLRPDWEKIKCDVMRTALKAKFSQHVDLKELLAKTGDAYLVEHAKNDSYWGDGGNGKGRNMLGTILMSIRDDIIQDQKLFRHAFQKKT